MHCAKFESGRCRSCSEIQRPYAEQLALKEAHCRSVLSGHAAVEWLPSIGSPERGFRNKAKMVVSGSVEAPVLGILDPQGQGVDLSDCPLYPAALQACFPILAAFISRARLAPYDVAARRGELKYLLLTIATHSGELMLRFVLRSQEPVARIRKHLPELLAQLPALKVVSVNLQPEHKAVLEGEQEIVLFGTTLGMCVNDVPLHLRPRSFFQTNDVVAAALYAQARDWVAQIAPASVWDLFCGVGGFALHAARVTNATVTGIEISAEAIASAEHSRAELGLDNVHFEALDAAAFAARGADAAELVIVNPPRRGIGADLCRFLDTSTARWLIYSSCNVESLARDLAAMPHFELRRARLMDMFPHTTHYEVVALLERATPANGDRGPAAGKAAD